MRPAAASASPASRRAVWRIGGPKHEAFDRYNDTEEGTATLRFDNRAVLTQTDAVVECIYGVVAGAVSRGNPP